MTTHTTTTTLFPCTTLFRSRCLAEHGDQQAERRGHDRKSRAHANEAQEIAFDFDAPNQAREAEDHRQNDHRDQTPAARSEEHTSELQSPVDVVCRLLLAKNS